MEQSDSSMTFPLSQARLRLRTTVQLKPILLEFRQAIILVSVFIESTNSGTKKRKKNASGAAIIFEGTV